MMKVHMNTSTKIKGHILKYILLKAVFHYKNKISIFEYQSNELSNDKQV